MSSKIEYGMLVTSLLAAVLIISGCASYSTSQSDDPRVTGRAAGSRGPVLSSSLMGPEGFSEQAIQKVLSSRLEIPKSVSIAVVRLDSHGEGLQFRPFDEETVEILFKGLKSSPRVRSVIPVPDSLLSKPVTLNSIRTAGVLVQADLVLVLKSVAAADWQYRMFERDQAKTTVVVESFVLDTRTSIVPFTGVTSEQADVAKATTDYSIYETQMRARIEGEKKAFKKIVADVSSLLGSRTTK